MNSRKQLVMDFSEDPSGESDISEDLDNDFRNILCVIKQYIPSINSNHQLSLYRSWLEKLSSPECDKTQRNTYLLELARQIRNNNLLPPFNMPPSTGLLGSLPKITHFRSPKLEPSPEYIPGGREFTDGKQRALFEQSSSSQQLLKESQMPRYTSPTPIVNYSCETANHPSFVDPPESYYYHPNYADEDIDETVDEKSKPSKTKKRKSKTVRGLQKSSPINFPQEPSDTSDKSPENVLRRPLNTLAVPPDTNNIPTSIQLEPQGNNVLKDESSWYDLTDASMSSVIVMGSGDAENPTSNPIVNQKPQKLSEFLRVLEEPTTDNDKASIRHAEIEDIQSHFPDDVDSLKRKLQDITEVKIGLNNTNFISNDWKKTIEALQLRLTETLNQNNELKSIIKSLEIKITQEPKTTRDETDDKAKKTLEITQRKEIETLQQIQKDNIKKLESSFQVKLGDVEKSYQQKIEDLGASYEDQIKELRTKYENPKKTKDVDICRLSDIIQQQCTRMSNEIAALRNQIEYSFSNNNNTEEKIVVLQKCVSKMDKLFLRSEKEYQKQVEKLKYQLGLKEKFLQIQLKSQRAELISLSSAEKQKQFDDVINSLEVKYIQMLEYHEAQVMETRQQDEEKIELLKSLLDDNGIPHDVV